MPMLEYIRLVAYIVTGWWPLIALSLLIFCCAWATYTDLTRRIVSNRNILVILLLALVTQIMQTVRGSCTWWYVLALTLLSLATGFGLYYLGYWSAGDGKFYAAVCVALPMAAPTLRFTTVPIQILSISLVGAFVFLMIRGARPLAVTLLQMLRGRLRFSGEQAAWGKRLSTAGLHMVQLTAFLGLTYLVSLVLPFQLGLLQALVLAMALSALLNLLVLWQRVAILTVLIGAAIVMFTRLPFVGEITFMLTYLFANVGRAMVRVIEKAMPRSVTCAELKPGYFVSQYVVIGPDGKEYHMSAGQWAKLDQESYTYVAGPSDGALTPRQVEQIQSLIESGRILANAPVALSWSIPFAPIITVAMIVTISASMFTHS